MADEEYEWLPDLVYFDDYEGDWDKYLEAIHDVFLDGFVNSLPSWPGKRLSLKRHPEYDGKSATFWHFISTGPIENDRLPDLRRCEQIGWPRPMIDQFTNGSPRNEDLVNWWKNKRGSNENYVLSLPDFSYVVVVADRGEYVLPWTAYSVDYPNRRRRLAREFLDYWSENG